MNTTAQGISTHDTDGRRLCDCCRTGCPDNDGPAEALATDFPTGSTQAFCTHCFYDKSHLEGCPECGTLINAHVRDAYELLFGGGSLSIDSLTEKVRSFERMASENPAGLLTDNDYAGLAVTSWLGGSYELGAMLAAVRHRTWEDAYFEANADAIEGQRARAHDAQYDHEPTVFGVTA